MDVRGLRDFARREREAVRRLKESFWAEECRVSAGLRNFEMGQRLFDHVRTIHPDWPTEEERAADLTHQVELKRRLDLTANVLAGS